MSIIVDIVASLIRLGMNLTGEKRAYMEWRISEDGRKYFSQEEQNAFYDALAKGDDSVIAVAIRERQKKIDELKKELGLD